MAYKELFSPQLIDLNIEAETQEDLFQLVAEKLKQEGLVHSSYFDGITQREKEFPTGLITQYLNIGLPHTDPEHVVKPFVFITRLNKEIIVTQMGDGQEMKTKNLFFLGIKDGKLQAGLLASFMGLFMNEEFVEKFIAINDKKEMYELFSNHI